MADNSSKSLFALVGLLASATFILWLASEKGKYGFMLAVMLAYGMFLYLKKHPL